LSARWRPSPTTAGSIARLSDYRKLFSLFLVLARTLAALGRAIPAHPHELDHLPVRGKASARCGRLQ
jgi:hypothetical protein